MIKDWIYQSESDSKSEREREKEKIAKEKIAKENHNIYNSTNYRNAAQRKGNKLAVYLTTTKGKKRI